MSAHVKAHPTEEQCCMIITIKMPNKKQRRSRIPVQFYGELEKFLNKFSDDESTSWESLAKERINKHKKAGLALRGARFREGISQNDLAQKSGISQDNISRIENGKRTVGEKVAKRLAKALHIDYRLLLENNS